jgi:outer membrane protein W
MFQRLFASLTFSALAVTSLPTYAAFYEIGASANYRRSAFDHDNFQELISYTASLSYYFMDMSAIELSYTNGYSELSVKSPDPIDPVTTTETNFLLIGIDLVFSIAEKDDVVQPYVKIGGGYLKKEVFQQVGDGDKTKIARSEGLVPSGGAGFKIMLTNSLSIKFGLDAWTTPLYEKPVVVDYSGRAGIGWMF